MRILIRTLISLLLAVPCFAQSFGLWTTSATPTFTQWDNFNRADNPSNLGSNWTVINWAGDASGTSAWKIASNTATSNGTGFNSAFYDGIWGPDQYSEATISSFNSGFTGVGVRMSQQGYYILIVNSSSWYVIYREANYGVLADHTISSGSGTFLIGDVLRLTISGYTLTAKQNGSTIFTGDDTGHYGPAGAPGLEAYAAGAAMVNWKGYSSSTAPSFTAASYVSSTALTSHSVTIGAEPLQSYVVVFIGTHPTWSSQPISVSSITANGSAMTLLAGPTDQTGAGHDLAGIIYYLPVSSPSSPITIALTLNNPAPVTMQVFDVISASGIPPTSTAIAGGDGSGGTNVSSASISAPSGSLLLGFCKTEYGYSPLATGSFSPVATVTAFLTGEFQKAPSTGSYSSSFNIQTSNAWQSALVVVPK